MPYQILNGARIPVKAFVKNISDIESSAIDQLRNVANLPWVLGLSAMGDVHWGNGATVGSVIVQRDALSPSVIGVDIACFSGDTKIKLVDGKDVSLKNLAAKKTPFFIFSCNEQMEIVVTQATASLTKKKARLLEITLDSGEKIKCTPDHEFLLKNGSYIEAQYLDATMSLMPLYLEEDKDGYPYVKQVASKKKTIGDVWSRVHWLVAKEGYLGEIPRYEKFNTTIHHKDENKRNNLPKNLEFMSSSEHSKIHIQERIANGTYHLNTSELEPKRLEGIRRYAATEEGNTKMVAKAIAIMQTVKSDPIKFEAFKEKVKDNGKRGKEFLVNFNSDPKSKEKFKAKKSFNCIFCDAPIKSDSFNGFHYQRKHKLEIRKLNEKNNHKIVKVKELAQLEDVYCLTVPKYHNFALSAGVFVHNCGMMAYETIFTADQLGGSEKIRELRHSIERSVPVGFNSNKEPTTRVLETFKDLGEPSERGKKFQDRALVQLGTLGGGNHFIEVCVDTTNKVWVMLHSGSRNIGKELAEWHIHKAGGLMGELAKKYPSITDSPIPKELAAFLYGTPDYDNYIQDLYWCQRFAHANREEMMLRVLKDLSYHVFGEERLPSTFVTTKVACHHNYLSEEETSLGKAFVTRKGAVSAKLGEMGLIPGSMGTKSYIVRGLGNADSFCSCSHGAGRAMSRGKAKKTFTIKDLEEQTFGVECRKDGGVLDELPSAYKNIEEVMDNQTDLVEIVAIIKQIICVKG